MTRTTKKGQPDLRFKAHNPLAGTRQPHNPTATNPPRTHEQLKAVTQHQQKLKQVEKGLIHDNIQ